MLLYLILTVWILEKIVFAILNASHSPDRVASLEDEHGAGGVIVPVQTLLPLSHPGGGLATLASNLTMSQMIMRIPFA